MARSMGPRFKLSRHLGANVFNHPKALKRGVKEHRNLSEYGVQLLEKQKLKAYYGVMEKQFKKCISDALRSKKNSEEALNEILESRLDNIVYKLNFGSTLRQARQMVNHGHIYVNGKKVDIPSYRTKVGDVISLRNKSRDIEMFKENFLSTPATYSYLQKDMVNFSGKITKTPTLEEVNIDVKYSKVFEYYSRN